MEFFDTHVHLGDPQFASDRAEVLERAKRQGVTRLVEIADSPRDWEAALALSRARPHVRCALGLHPYHAWEFSPELLERLRVKVRLPEVVGVGEIGLDYVKSKVPREAQRKAFEGLLCGSLEWGMPAIIHCRGATQDLLAILKNLCPGPPPGNKFWGVVHCFSGSPEDAVSLAGLGFALGADGPVTYPKNEALREAFRQAGPSSLVLETDSPYLPPQSSRGQRNEPGAIPEIAAKMAEILRLKFPDILGR